MPKPTIVAIPGAWHSPAAFETVTKKLEALGYTVLSRQMPSVGSDPPPEDLSDDVAAVRDLVLKAIGDSNDVVVVPHSWSGIVAGSALVGLGKKQREANGEKGGVIRTAFMCSFVVPEGVSLMDVINHEIPGWWDIKVLFLFVLNRLYIWMSDTHDKKGPYTFPNDPNIFYNDLSAEEQQKWMSKLQTHAFATKKAKSTGAAWKEIPSSYLICEDDNAIPKVAQEAMTKGAKDAGAEMEIEVIKASHSPFLSQPDRVVEFIRRAAGEKV
ncbi:alpha/beta-hydrolase [Zopfia rhizophila CBS 207.26]|uniref:Alpha/beta-hydrolase n=1 Tax=Zopfia rhizophila CBS 207.26 TaxID=1314779 RepID=A0A6A6DZU3_9PEZI|nr:alpha/beta-hydrolase [Zopfia rhizophila CBS 207.26]